MSTSAISRGCSGCIRRRSVERWRGRRPDAHAAEAKSLLDAHRAYVDQLLAEGVWNAQVIYRELQARGYAGKLSILRDYIRPKRALRPLGG